MPFIPTFHVPAQEFASSIYPQLNEAATELGLTSYAQCYCDVSSPGDDDFVCWHESAPFNQQGLQIETDCRYVNREENALSGSPCVTATPCCRKESVLNALPEFSNKAAGILRANGFTFRAYQQWHTARVPARSAVPPPPFNPNNLQQICNYFGWSGLPTGPIPALHIRASIWERQGDQPLFARIWWMEEE